MKNYINPFTALLTRWKGEDVFDDDHVLQLDLGGMFCISFDTGKGEDFDTFDPGDILRLGRKRFHCDLIPICFPKGVKKVTFKEGSNDIAWEIDKHIDFQVGKALNHTNRTFLMSGMVWPIPKEEQDRIDDFHWLEARHICELLGICNDDQAVGGVGCSHFVPIDDKKPVVFYLKKGGLKDISDKPGGVKAGESVPEEIDAYLIPTILPNGTILWLSITRDPNDDEKNARNIAYWTEADADFIGFNGELVFVDKLGITILEVSNDTTVAKPIKLKKKSVEE